MNYSASIFKCKTYGHFYKVNKYNADADIYLSFHNNIYRLSFLPILLVFCVYISKDLLKEFLFLLKEWNIAIHIHKSNM